MGKKDPRIDAFIAGAAEFARPILNTLRKAVHEGCPEIVETMKWRMPFYDYKGLLIGTPAFKQHCAIVFWRDIQFGPDATKSEAIKRSLRRVTSASDLPNRTTLLTYIRDAVSQRDNPVGRPKQPRRPAQEPVVPADLKRALAKNSRAAATFRNFSPSHRREYIEWITTAKRPETRQHRLATTLKWLAEGKPQTWKYQATRAAAKR